MMFKLERKLKRRFDQAERIVRRRCLDILTKRPRNTLPFGRLKDGRGGIRPQLETASGLDCDKAAMKIGVQCLHTADDGICGRLGERSLPGGLKEIFSDHAAMQFHFPRLESILSGTDGQKVRDLLPSKA